MAMTNPMSVRINVTPANVLAIGFPLILDRALRAMRYAAWPIMALCAPGFASAQPASPPPRAESPAARGGEHDFEFESGAWMTHVRRLQRPLSGSSTWVEYDGTTTVTPLLGGRANVAELHVSGPAGRIDGAALRIYEAQARRWAIHYFSAADGELTAPLFGRFEGGVGRFEGDDKLGERAIRVRFEIREAGSGTWRFEQAFSGDGGRTWEVNWIAEDRRAK